MEMKQCTDCKEFKSVKGWHKNNARPDGLHGKCNECSLIYVRERKKRLRTNDPAKLLWESSRNRAREHNRYSDRKIEFNIKPEDIKVPEVCPVLGIRLQFNNGEAGCKGNRFNDHTPSLDRIDSSKGYLPDNIIVISWRANRIKCDATVKELNMIAEFFTKLECDRNYKSDQLLKPKKK